MKNILCFCRFEVLRVDIISAILYLTKRINCIKIDSTLAGERKGGSYAGQNTDQEKT